MDFETPIVNRGSFCVNCCEAEAPHFRRKFNFKDHSTSLLSEIYGCNVEHISRWLQECTEKNANIFICRKCFHKIESLKKAKSKACEIEKTLHQETRKIYFIAISQRLSQLRKPLEELFQWFPHQLLLQENVLK